MKRFKNILLLMNDKDEQTSAFQRAVTLTTHNQAKLTVFCVLEDFTDLHHLFDRIHPHEIIKNMIKERPQCLEEMIAPLRQKIEVDINCTVLAMKPEGFIAPVTLG